MRSVVNEVHSELESFRMGREETRREGSARRSPLLAARDE
jgi:hypothetical protein